MQILKSNIKDHVELTELTKKSKAFWGYSENQIIEWDEFLTISEKYISVNEVYKLMMKNIIIGYYSYFKVSDKKIKLDNLFILPDFIGKKYGAYLMEDLFSRTKKSGISIITLNSEPNSEDFYKKLGFNVVGEIETSIKNRFMPVMEIKL